MGETALGEFEKGCQNALFLEFAERCKHMTKHRVEALNEDQLLCSHHGNRFLIRKEKDSEKPQVTVGSEWIPDEPNCCMVACPIFQKMEFLGPISYERLWVRFCERLEEL